MTCTIGIISDTHGLLRPVALRMLAHVDHIIHGGDIGDPEIIPALRRIAPVTAIRGNVDTGSWATAFADTEFVQLPAVPGAGRFNLPITLASLDVTPDGLKPIIHDLEVG
jgi:predicted phosphodiesterase